MVFGIFYLLFSLSLSRTFSIQFIIQNIKSLLYGYDASIGAIWFLPALFICKQLHYIQRGASWNSPIISLLSFSVLIVTPHYLSFWNINLPLFADSALFGLPFFILGNNCFSMLESMSRHKTITLLPIPIVMLPLTVILAVHNDFVSIASCNYGNSLCLYYLNAISGIGAVIGLSMLLRNYNKTFITITSYGTIVTLGFHGIILLLLQYYIPRYFLGGIHLTFT